MHFWFLQQITTKFYEAVNRILNCPLFAKMVKVKNNSLKPTIIDCQSTADLQLAGKSIEREYLPTVGNLLMTCLQYVDNVLLEIIVPTTILLQITPRKNALTYCRRCNALWGNSIGAYMCFQLCSLVCKSSEILE